VLIVDYSQGVNLSRVGVPAYSHEAFTRRPCHVLGMSSWSRFRESNSVSQHIGLGDYRLLQAG
jgi:hypothetical protein